jgi:hypothetical protein
VYASNIIDIMNLKSEDLIEKAIIISIFEVGTVFGLFFKINSLSVVAVSTLITGILTVLTGLF